MNYFHEITKDITHSELLRVLWSDKSIKDENLHIILQSYGYEPLIEINGSEFKDIYTRGDGITKHISTFYIIKINKSETIYLQIVDDFNKPYHPFIAAKNYLFNNQMNSKDQASVIQYFNHGSKAIERFYEDNKISYYIMYDSDPWYSGDIPISFNKEFLKKENINVIEAYMNENVITSICLFINNKNVIMNPYSLANFNIDFSSKNRFIESFKKLTENEINLLEIILL